MTREADVGWHGCRATCRSPGRVAPPRYSQQGGMTMYRAPALPYDNAAKFIDILLTQFLSASHVFSAHHSFHAES